MKPMRESDTKTILRTVRTCLDAGLSVVPVNSETKRPLFKWLEYQQRIPDKAEWREWAKGQPTAIAVIGGAVSGGLEILDFDANADAEPQAYNAEDFFGPWWNAVGETVEQHDLPVWRTGGGGYQVAYRCEQVEGNSKLAWVPNSTQQHGRSIAIETRGEGGYAVVPPSLHPSGNQYEMIRGDLASVPTIPVEVRMLLWEAAQSLDLMPYTSTERDAVKHEARRNVDDTDNVIETFNAAHNVADLLAQHGYTRQHNGRYSRPGKADSLGVSVIPADNIAFHWSSNDPLHRSNGSGNPLPVDPFEVVTQFAYGGDHKAAYIAAKKELGQWQDTPEAPLINFNGARTAKQDVRSAEEAATVEVLSIYDYRPEDGGVLDAWLDLAGDEWLFAAGPEKWHRWGGTHWEPQDEYAIRREFQSLLDDMNRCARDMRKAAEEKETQKILDAYIGATKRTHARVSSLEAMARNVKFVDGDTLNSIDLLNTANGTLDLLTEELRPHSRDDLLTYCLPYEYDPQAQATYWNIFMGNFPQDVRDFLHEFAGYALTTDTSHEIALWLYGPPGGGKSTFLAGLEAMLGPKAGVLGLADIEKSRFALANLPGKTLVVSAEQPGDFIKCTHILNSVISGEPVSFERKFKDAQIVTPRCKMIWAMNDLPRVSDANNGIFRRVKVVGVPAVPEDRQSLDMKEEIRKEGSGILNECIAGLKRLRERGRFDVPASVVDATREFVQQNDIAANFVAECCKVGPIFNVSSAVLYAAYQQWALGSGHRPKSSTAIALDWRRLGFEKYLAKGQSRWRGIELGNGIDSGGESDE